MLDYRSSVAEGFDVRQFNSQLCSWVAPGANTLKRQDGRTVTSGDTKSIATGRKQGVDELKEPSPQEAGEGGGGGGGGVGERGRRSGIAEASSPAFTSSIHHQFLVLHKGIFCSSTSGPSISQGLTDVFCPVCKYLSILPNQRTFEITLQEIMEEKGDSYSCLASAKWQNKILFC